MAGNGVTREVSGKKVCGRSVDKLARAGEAFLPRGSIVLRGKLACGDEKARFVDAHFVRRFALRPVLQHVFHGRERSRAMSLEVIDFGHHHARIDDRGMVVGEFLGQTRQRECDLTVCGIEIAKMRSSRASSACAISASKLASPLPASATLIARSAKALPSLGLPATRRARPSWLSSHVAGGMPAFSRSACTSRNALSALA